MQVIKANTDPKRRIGRRDAHLVDGAEAQHPATLSVEALRPAEIDALATYLGGLP
jgi:hypothetical protein